MASGTLNRTVILTLFLTLVLDFEPFDSSVSIHNGSNSILIALSPLSRQTSTVPPSLKGKACCHLLNVALTASCLILLSGDISRNPGPVKDP